LILFCEYKNNQNLKLKDSIKKFAQKTIFNKLNKKSMVYTLLKQCPQFIKQIVHKAPKNDINLIKLSYSHRVLPSSLLHFILTFHILNILTDTNCRVNYITLFSRA
jgi:hypothetical protein